MLDELDIIRLGVLSLERINFIERRFARLNGIDEIVLDGNDIVVAQVAFEQI